MAIFFLGNITMKLLRMLCLLYSLIFKTIIRLLKETVMLIVETGVFIYISTKHIKHESEFLFLITIQYLLSIVAILISVQILSFSEKLKPISIHNIYSLVVGLLFRENDSEEIINNFTTFFVLIIFFFSYPIYYVLEKRSRDLLKKFIPTYNEKNNNTLIDIYTAFLFLFGFIPAFISLMQIKQNGKDIMGSDILVILMLGFVLPYLDAMIKKILMERK